MLRAPCVQEPELEPGSCLQADWDIWPPRWSVPNVPRAALPAQLPAPRGLRDTGAANWEKCGRDGKGRSHTLRHSLQKTQVQLGGGAAGAFGVDIWYDLTLVSGEANGAACPCAGSGGGVMCVSQMRVSPVLPLRVAPTESPRRSRAGFCAGGWFDAVTAGGAGTWHCPAARLAPALAGWCPGKLLPLPAVLL